MVVSSCIQAEVLSLPTASEAIGGSANGRRRWCGEQSVGPLRTASRLMIGPLETGLETR